MKTSRLACAFVGVVAACGTQEARLDHGDDHVDVDHDDDPPTPPTDMPDAPPPPPPAMACSNVAGFELDMGAGGLELQSDVAVDAAGDIYYASAARGMVKLSADGVEQYALPFGEVVAVDGAGNAYVAASFRADIDPGLGLLTPEGNVDAFLMKLDPSGFPLMVKQLHVCGDGLRSLAVAPNGRIAVSGSAMGTLVLDAQGNVIFADSFSGALAFDAQSHLVAGGEFTGLLDIDPAHRFRTSGDADGFVVKLDLDGNVEQVHLIGDPALPYVLGPALGVTDPTTFEVTERSRQAVSSVAADAQGNVYVIGHFDRGGDVFGTTYLGSLAFATSRDRFYGGGFLVKLDPAGNVAFNQQFDPVSATPDVAVDLQGVSHVVGSSYVNQNQTGRTGFRGRISQVGGVLLSASGETDGVFHAVAVDACGSAIVSSSEFEAGAGLVARLTKYVP